MERPELGALFVGDDVGGLFGEPFLIGIRGWLRNCGLERYARHVRGGRARMVRRRNGRQGRGEDDQQQTSRGGRGGGSPRGARFRGEAANALNQIAAGSGEGEL